MPDDATGSRAATRDMTDYLDGLQAGVDSSARAAAGLLMTLQPDHFSQFDVGWNAALHYLVRELFRHEDFDA